MRAALSKDSRMDSSQQLVQHLYIFVSSPLKYVRENWGFIVQMLDMFPHFEKSKHNTPVTKKTKLKTHFVIETTVDQQILYGKCVVKWHWNYCKGQAILKAKKKLPKISENIFYWNTIKQIKIFIWKMFVRWCPSLVFVFRLVLHWLDDNIT